MLPLQRVVDARFDQDVLCYLYFERAFIGRRVVLITDEQRDAEKAMGIEISGVRQAK
jgi:hypothetical protein